MAYVITDNCIKDELCIEACPVDCIHPRKDEADFEAAAQMYVDPAGCIDCDGPGLRPISFRDVNATHRRRPVRSRLEPL